MRQPEVPAGMWSSINASLSETANEPVRATVPWRRYSQFGIAATLLIAASIALVAFWNRHPTDEHREMAETFGEYLDRFQQQPENAQEVLLTRYQGRLVDPQQAVGEATFKPNAPDKLPQGFSRAAMYVLTMPCCTCTQTIYKDDNGNVLALFEHTDQQRSWFGDRPTITAQCHGKSTCIVQLQGELAACWKCGPRHLTIVARRRTDFRTGGLSRCAATFALSRPGTHVMDLEQFRRRGATASRCGQRGTQMVCRGGRAISWRAWNLAENVSSRSHDA